MQIGTFCGQRSEGNTRPAAIGFSSVRTLLIGRCRVHPDGMVLQARLRRFRVLPLVGLFMVITAAAIAVRGSPKAGTAGMPSASSSNHGGGTPAESQEGMPVPSSGQPKAVLLSNSGGWLQDFAAGRDPSKDRPRGTLLVSYSDDRAAFVAEIDLATHAMIGRKQVAAQRARVHLNQEGSNTYALVDTEAEHHLVKIGEELSITRLAKLAARFERAHAFTVAGGRPIVLPAGSDAIVLVFNSNGKLAAKRNCKAGLWENKIYPLHVRDGRVFLTNLVMREYPEGVCAFDIDGKGPIDRLNPREDQSFHFEPRMELKGEDEEGNPWTAPVNRRLRVGRKHRDTSDDPVGEEQQMCSGVGGTAVQRTAVVHGVQIIHTYNCCGDNSPAGIWVCPK